MLGNPKYKYGEEVLFDIDGRSLKGRIYIVDAYGTFFDMSHTILWSKSHLTLTIHVAYISI